MFVQYLVSIKFWWPFVIFYGFVKPKLSFLCSPPWLGNFLQLIPLNLVNVVVGYVRYFLLKIHVHGAIHIDLTAQFT